MACRSPSASSRSSSASAGRSDGEVGIPSGTCPTRRTASSPLRRPTGGVVRRRRREVDRPAHDGRQVAAEGLRQAISHYKGSARAWSPPRPVRFPDQGRVGPIPAALPHRAPSQLCSAGGGPSLKVAETPFPLDGSASASMDQPTGRASPSELALQAARQPCHPSAWLSRSARSGGLVGQHHVRATALREEFHRHLVSASRPCAAARPR